MHRPDTYRWWTLFQMVPLAIAVGLFITTFAGRASLVDTHELNIMGEEQNIVYGVIKWMQGTPLYSDPEALPMDIIQYPPAFYYLAGGLGTAFAVDTTEPQEVYVLIRTIGLVLNLLFAWSCYWIARELGAPWWWAVLWGTVLFSFLPRQVYSRPDALNLVLFAGSMYFLLRGAGRRSSNDLLFATLLGCAAVMAKQSGVLALGVIGAWALFTRQWTVLLRHVVLSTIVLAICIGWLCLHYGTHVIVLNLVTSIRNGIDLTLFRTLLTPRFLGMFLVQAIALVLCWRWWRGTGPQLKALSVAYSLSIAFGYATSIKYGSSTAYYMEGMLLATAAMALWSGSSWVVADRSRLVGISLLALLFIQPRQVAWGATVLLGRDTVVNELHEYQEAKAMAAFLREDPRFRKGLVLVYYHDHLENFLVGRSVLTQKDIYQLPTSAAHYDLSAYRNALEDGTIRFVVMRSPGPLALVGDAHPPLALADQRNGYLLYINSASEALAPADHAY